MWNCGLLTGLFYIVWTTDAWIWSIRRAITKRRNWKKKWDKPVPVRLCPQHTSQRTAMRMNLDQIKGNMASNHLTHATPNQKYCFCSLFKSFPLFVMHFFPFYSFHSRFSLSNLFLRFVTLFFFFLHYLRALSYKTYWLLPSIHRNSSNPQHIRGQQKKRSKH